MAYKDLKKKKAQYLRSLARRRARYASDEAFAEATRAAARAYRGANEERVRERQRAIAAKHRADPQKAEKQREYARRYYQENRERSRKNVRKRRGLPSPTRPEPDACECCGVLVARLDRALAVDHDHTTGVFRGWLCAPCNLGLGNLGDTLAAIDRAREYLLRAQ